jgi:hypothetical protein
MKRVGRLALSLTLCAAAVACSDDEHKGTISTGSAEPTASATAVAETKERLVYSPGTPIASMRVAERFKRRLEKAGLKGVNVKIGGEVVHVDAPPKKVAAVKEALSGGRLDLYVFAASTNPFADANEEDLAPLKLGSETVSTSAGQQQRRYLTGEPDQRDQMTKIASDKSLGAKAFVGPVYEAGKKTGLRSYFADADRSLRGEMVAKAAVESEGDETTLVITFEDRGKNFLRWQGKEKSRLLVRVDGDIVAAVQLTEPIKDGALRVPWKGDPAQAKAIAASLDGVAVSHETVLKEDDEK